MIGRIDQRRAAAAAPADFVPILLIEPNVQTPIFELHSDGGIV